MSRWFILHWFTLIASPFLLAVNSLHRQFGVLGETTLLLINGFVVVLALVSLLKVVSLVWKPVKAQEKARFKKEREELAKAEVVLNGPLHNWK